MKQFIFLDIDGVLNSDKFYSEQSQNEYQDTDIDPKAISLLNKLIFKTKADIIISSDWKYEWEETLVRLKRAGLKGNIIGSTPEDSEHFCRGKEIQLWFDYHSCQFNDGYINYVILDDREDILETQIKNYVHVNPSEGFTEFTLDRALSKFVILE